MSDEENGNSRKTHMTSRDADWWLDETDDKLKSMAGAVLPGTDNDDVREAAAKILAGHDYDIFDQDEVEEAWENMEKGSAAKRRQQQIDEETEELWEQQMLEQAAETAEEWGITTEEARELDDLNPDDDESRMREILGSDYDDWVNCLWD